MTECNIHYNFSSSMKKSRRAVKATTMSFSQSVGPSTNPWTIFVFPYSSEEAQRIISKLGKMIHDVDAQKVMEPF